MEETMFKDLLTICKVLLLGADAPEEPLPGICCLCGDLTVTLQNGRALITPESVFYNLPQDEQTVLVRTLHREGYAVDFAP